MESFTDIDQLYGDGFVDVGMFIAGGEVYRDDGFLCTVQLNIVADAIRGGFTAIADMSGRFGDGIVILSAAGLEGDKEEKQEAW